MTPHHLATLTHHTPEELPLEASWSNSPIGEMSYTVNPEAYHYWETIKKRWRTILASTLVGCCFAAAYCAIKAPIFTARTTIELRGHAPVLSSLQSETLFGTDTRKIEYQKTTVAKLTLEGVADQVLSQDGLARDLHEYWSESHSPLLARLRSHTHTQSTPDRPDSEEHTTLHFSHSPRTLKRYLSLISIIPVHETNLVYINASTSDPRLSQKIANAHATQFIEHLRRERQDSIKANVRLLRAQAETLKQRVSVSENQLATYAAQNKLVAARGDDPNTPNTRQIDSLAQLVADATGRRIRAESAYQEARQQRESDSAVSDTEITKELRVSLKQAETEYATQGSQLTAEYPTMRELQAKISALRKAILEERRRALTTLQSQYESERNAELSLRQQVEEEKAKAQEVARGLIQYSVLSKEASSLRDLYQTVVKQAQEIEMSASTTSSNVYIADYATLPTQPSAPKRNIIVIICAILGLASGVVMALIRESLQDTLSSQRLVQATLDLPLLGSVPSFDITLSKPKGSSAPPQLKTTSSQETPLPVPIETPPSSFITISSPHSTISEALRTIRANLLLSSADYPPRVVAITSAIQGEGKTTIMSNLGVTLAQANHRTLVIDADLRMAGLTKLFASSESTNARGLSDFITGQISLEEAIHPTPIPYLDRMPAGSLAPNPAELVGSESMRRLLSVLRERYDFILIDTPPIMAVADGLLLARLVDSVIMIVRHDVTPRRVALEARAKLARIRARVIGCVINEVPASSFNRSTMLYGANYVSGESSITNSDQ